MPVSKKVFEDQVLGLLGSLQGVARRLTRNEADAEDLVAETVSRAWRALDTLESEAAFRAWIFRILNNTFISNLRSASARVQLDPFECGEAPEDEADFSVFEQMHQPFLLWFSNPEQEFLDKLLREDLDRALAALPDCYRVVVVMSDLEEFSYAEIAQALAIPVGTVRSRLARARSALQKALWRQARAYGLKGEPTVARGGADAEGEPNESSMGQPAAAGRPANESKGRVQ